MFRSGGIAKVVGVMLLMALAPSTTALEPGPIDPLGEYTIEMAYGDTVATASLAISPDDGASSQLARLALPDEPILVLGTVDVDGRSVTLADQVGAAKVAIELRFEDDETFTGGWSIGSLQGVAAGRRGAGPATTSDPPRCADGTGRLPPPAHTPPPSPDPDATRIVTSDVDLFWQAVDSGAADTLAVRLHCEYLRRGTDALRDFIPRRIVSGEVLAEAVAAHRERYESMRQSGLALAALEPQIRAVFRELKARYSDAVFPDLYFVVGRFNTGGTISQRGLLIGAEMHQDHDAVLAIVAHELVHYQQRPMGADQRTLLAQAIMEGSANFVAELITGDHINHDAHAYGLPRERALWDEFRQVMHGSDFAGWLYGNPPGERPADMGYFIGYRIAQAYFANAGANAQALREILEVSDYAGFLARSGYDP